MTTGRAPRVSAPAAAGSSGGNGRLAGVADAPVELVDGAVTSGPDLSVEVNGLRLPNPFVIGSGPPGTNYQVRCACVRVLGGGGLEGGVGCIRSGLSSANHTNPQHQPPGHRHHHPTPTQQVMKKAFDEGWGGVICKTLSLDAGKVVNVTPRYAKLRDASGQVFGWENIELISDR